ncbi:rpl-14, partial [Pristionchus pacificus]|uniref:Large ribosomal subunit protein eL14 n=4 Tax=Pristionchus TaxID=54125 RepID=A0A2A6BU50_PRIPA
TMVYKRMVEIGRVVYVAKGENEGKLATIVNIVDGNKVLLDGPASGVLRSVRNLKDLQLTKFKVPIRLQQRTKNVEKAWTEAEISKKWQESTWAKKLAARKLRSTLSDFDRYKLMRAKQARNRLVKVELAKLKKAARKA